MGVPNSPPGWAGVPKHWDGYHRKEQWWGFIANAEYFGLPVGMLKTVGRSYSFGVLWVGKLAETDTYLNKINLESASDYDQLVGLRYGPPRGVTGVLGTAYHEGSHALLDVRENEPAFKTFIADGRAHYTGAPLADGTTSQDPERLLTEAVATYVADRAVTWWLAFDALATLTADAEAGRGTPQARARLAGKARTDYNAVAKRSSYVYGYDMSRGVQAETTRPMSAAMRAFVDKELLEGRIPDDFDAATRLVPLYHALLAP